MKRTVWLGVLTMLVVVACGGTDDVVTNTLGENGATTTAADNGESDDATSGTSTETTVAQDDQTDSPGVSTATIVIDGISYTYQATGFFAEVCNPNFFGGFQAVLFMVDENGEMLTIDDKKLSVDLALAPEGVDESVTSFILLSIPPGHEDLIADPDRDDRSGVDSFVIDGNGATGSATFVNISSSGSAPVGGTFSVTCVEG